MEDKIYETPDLSFAAFLKMQGYKLIDIGRLKDGSSRFKFIFEIDNKIIEREKVDFINSESYKFDLNARSLRSLIKTGGRIK